MWNELQEIERHGVSSLRAMENNRPEQKLNDLNVDESTVIVGCDND